MATGLLIGIRHLLSCTCTHSTSCATSHRPVVIVNARRARRLHARLRQARLRAATAKILADPDYVARLAAMAVEPMVMTPEQASAFVAAEVRKWKTVAAAAKIQVE